MERPTSACEKASATFNFTSSFLMIKPPYIYYNLNGVTLAVKNKI
jgi:hypothetical protein